MKRRHFLARGCLDQRRPFVTAIAVCAVISAASVRASAAPTAHWAPAGAPGSVLTLAIDPSNPDTLYAGLQSGGIYKTVDGVRHWSPTNVGVPAGRSIVQVAVDPTDPSHLYAAAGPLSPHTTSAVYLSTDGGSHWGRAPNDPTRFTAFSLAIDPDDGQIAVLSGYGIGTPLFRTTDGGLDWTPGGGDAANDSLAQAVVFDPADSTHLYAGANGGILESTDTGATWTLIGAGPPGNGGVGRLAVDGHDGTLYATGHGLYKSTDGGHQWESIGDGLPQYQVKQLVVDTSAQGRVYAAAKGGIYRTSDAGAHWRRLTDGSTGGTAAVVALDPADPAVVYGGTARGVIKTTDDGHTWAFARQGLGGACLTSIAVDAGDPSTLYAGDFTLGIVHRTRDGGRRWTEEVQGLPRVFDPYQPGIPLLTETAVDPFDPKTVLEAMPGIGVFKSTDGGVHWVESDTGIANLQVRAVAFDPVTPSVVFAGSDMLYRSDDAGDTWTPTSLAMKGAVGEIAFDPSNPATIYVATQNLPPETGGYLWRSTDGGATWPKSITIVAGWNITALAVDPFDPNTIVLSIRPDFVNQFGWPRTERSTDGGKTWTVLSDLTYIDTRDIVFDPSTSGVVYGATVQGVMATTDHGAHWAPMNMGLVARQASDLFIGQSGSPLYLATCGGLFVFRTG